MMIQCDKIGDASVRQQLSLKTEEDDLVAIIELIRVNSCLHWFTI